MTFKELQHLLVRLKYKPGASFRLHVSDIPNDPRPIQIRISQKVPNVHAQAPSELTDVTLMKNFGMRELEDWTPDRIVHIIYHMLVDQETHEVHEWFRWDGLHVVEPHPELRPQMAAVRTSFKEKIRGVLSKTSWLNRNP